MTAKAIDAGVIGLAETNADWKKVHLRDKYTYTIKNLCRQSDNFKSWKTSKTQFSTSQIPSISSVQRGGTTTTTFGKWVGRVSASGNDERLGRWTWMTFKGDTNLTVITAYRVCQEKGNSGEMTAHAQQASLLLNRTPTPDPRNQILEDLKALISEKRQSGEAVILMIDANEESLSPNSKLRRTMDSLAMSNLHHIIHGEGCPNTYTRGQHQIDHIFGCPRIASNTTNAGVLPFKFGIDSDHRGLYVDVEVQNIFRSTTTDLQYPKPRKLSSLNKKHADALRTVVTKSCKNQNIHSRLRQLSTVPPNRWHNQHQDALNKIDDTFTKIVLAAEAKVCHKPYGYPISEKLIQAGQLLRYWKTKLSNLLIPTIDLQHSIQHLEDELDIPHNIRTGSNSINDIKENISVAKSKLKSIQKEAYRHREEWLREKALDAAHDSNITVEQATVNLASREKSKRMYSRIKRDLSQNQRSSVYYIEVPADGKPPKQSKQWKEVRAAESVHHHLLKHSEEHYRLAQPTPFGKTDRGWHLGFTGTGHVAHDILNGTYDYKLEELHEEARQFIQELRKQDCPTMNTTITSSEVFQLFSKWNENTSTSPSNFHLGLYKALIRSTHALSILTLLMNLPLKHGKPLSRWENSTMCMIEKDIGSPKLHRLRLIHLFEADMNGIAKIIWARRFIYHCQDHHLLHSSQHGGLPGFETQHVLLKFRMTTDSAAIMRHNLAINNNDAEACYDRIIPAINGISHLSKGMPLSAIHLQNSLLLNMKYSVRTAHGTSSTTWTNSEADPKFGLGQGGGWSPPGWASLSTDMIHTHAKVSDHGMTIPSVIGSEDSTSRTIDAYVDDANNGVNDGDQQDDIKYTELLMRLEQSSQQWERILNITGGNLNLQKCFCSLLTWKWDCETPSPSTLLEEPGEMEITNSVTGRRATIERLESNQSFKLLGVWVQLHGPMKIHLSELQKKIRELTRNICKSELTNSESMTAYKRVAFKQLEYSLPMTTYSINEIKELQNPFTSAFLANSGYHSRFPRALVYAPERYGGIGLEHLYQARGILQLKYLISHIRNRDELGKLMICILEQLQLFSGVSTPILSHPNSEEAYQLKYLPPTWILTLRDFLKTFNGSIEFPEAWLPHPQRQHDSIIMDRIHTTTKSKTTLSRINACRLYMRVLTVADITDPTGQYIEQKFITGDCYPCASKLLWPRQSYPSQRCWTAWKKAIIQTYLSSSKQPYELAQHLGPWQRSPDGTFPIVVDPHTKSLYKESNIQGVYHKLEPSESHRNQYNIDTGEESMLPEIAIPVKHYIQDNKIKIASIPYTSEIIAVEPRSFNQYKRTLPEAIQELLQYVETVGTHEDVADLLRRGTPLIIASDGSKKDKGGTYGWILETTNGDLIAEGMGPVHGNISTITSHRAELYGLTSVITYLLHICTYYKLNTSLVKAKLYCDNSECVQKVNNALKVLRGTTRYMKADYDIESVLRQTVSTLKADIKAQWIKGHQDENTAIEDLSHPAQMNVAADELAEYAYEVCVPSKEHHSPFPSTTISLIIANKRVTSHMTQQIEDAIHVRKLQKYRNNKYNWSPLIWETIDWYAYSIALKQQQPGHKRFLHRFTCEWLPVGARTKFYHKHGVSKCVSCQSDHDESSEHIFQCNNPRRRDRLFQRIIHFTTILRKKHTYKPIIKILQTNIMQWIKKETLETVNLPTNPTLYDHTLQEAVEEQTAIGWEHILKGWLSTKWAQAQGEYYRERCKNDTKINLKYHNAITWSKLVIRGLQDIAFDTWKFRNKDIYGHDKKEEEVKNLENMKAKVRQEYDRRHSFPAKIQWRYFTRTVSDRANDSIQKLRAWYENLQAALIAMEERPFPTTGIG